jgi:hypothetical protein
MKTRIVAIIAGAILALAMTAQVVDIGRIAVFSGGRWTYPRLGSSFSLANGVLDVPVTTGPAGPAGVAGPQGSPGVAGPAGAAFIPAPPDVYAAILSAMPSVGLKCSPALIYRNGLLDTPGVDYTVTGTVATFLDISTPQPGDNVQVAYACAAP